MDKPLIFLSHAGEDSQPAKELARQLGEAGLEVWLDVERLKPGDRWMAEIETGLRQAMAFVLYVGKSGVRNWVDQEVRVALDRSTKEKDFRLIPVLGPGADADALPLFLKQYQWLDLRKGFTEAAQLKALIEGATQRPAEGVSLLPPGKSPFRGLQAFDVEDSLLFFGRDAEIQDLLDKLRTDSFLAVVGDSGSGKSSLVRAGLIPALHRGRFHDGRDWVESWRIAITRPGDDPFGELAKALPDLKPEMSEVDKANFIDDRRARLGRESDTLDSAIASLVPRGCHTLLVVDQFEELFTLGRTADPAKKERPVDKWGPYVDALFAAARSAGERPVHVLITLRADFYSRCWDHARLTDQMGANQYTVRRAGAERLQEVIEKPLALAGAKAQAGLVDAILADVGDEPGNLPLLEHALSQLWDRRKGHEITHDAYTKIGRLSGALKNHANDVLKNLGSENRDLARKIFLHLTQLGEGAEDTRRRAGKAELIALGAGSDAAERILKVLTDARLVTSSRGAAETKEGDDRVAADSARTEEMIEVSHEALIREWPELRKWVDASRDELRIERRLFEAATEWEKAKRDAGLLWSGTRLAQANEWIQRHQREVSPVVRAFQEASEQQVAAEGKRAKRLRRLVMGMAVAVVLAVVGFMWWIARDAQARATKLFEESIVRDPPLMWERTDNLESVNWTEADQYCKDLRLGGYSDWRLPAIDELEKLYNPKDGTRYNIRKPFKLTSYWVWSSTKEGSDSAWGFYFSGGKRNHHRLVNSDVSRALCVRRSGE